VIFYVFIKKVEKITFLHTATTLVIDSLILKFGTSRRWTENFKPGCFTARNAPRYSLNRRLGGLQILSGHFGGEKNLFLLLEFKPPLSLASQHI